MLVSVRNAAEARAALTGGCDILDVKEPARGALGMADISTIEQVLTAANQAGRCERCPATAALGEAREWIDGRALPAIPAGLWLVKLGLAGLADNHWQTRWRQVRSRLEDASGRRLRWIAVVYADWRSAGAPSPAAVIDTAIETGCAGVLIDTYAKDGRHLLNHLQPSRLHELAAPIRPAGLLIALAGSLTCHLLPDVMELRPDVIAIRGAACGDEGRRGDVSASAVAAFRAGMSAAAAPNRSGAAG